MLLAAAVPVSVSVLSLVTPSPATPLSVPKDAIVGAAGATVSTATAYDPAATTHKALFFATWEDDLTDRSSSLPPDWTVNFSPEGDALRAIDLVVCARRTAAHSVGADGLTFRLARTDQPDRIRFRMLGARHQLCLVE